MAARHGGAGLQADGAVESERGLAWGNVKRRERARDRRPFDWCRGHVRGGFERSTSRPAQGQARGRRVEVKPDHECVRFDQRTGAGLSDLRRGESPVYQRTSSNTPSKVRQYGSCDRPSSIVWVAPQAQAAAFG